MRRPKKNATLYLRRNFLRQSGAEWNGVPVRDSGLKYEVQ